MELVDEAYFGAAQQSPPLVVEPAAVLAGDQNRAAIGTLQQTRDMQHR